MSISICVDFEANIRRNILPQNISPNIPANQNALKIISRQYKFINKMAAGYTTNLVSYRRNLTLSFIENNVKWTIEGTTLVSSTCHLS